MKVFAGVTGIIMGFLAIVVLVAVVTFGVRWVTASPKGKLAAREQIQSGNYRIQAYNHFFDLCASVQTMDQALNESHDQLRTAKGNDRSRIETNIGAQLNSRNDAMNQYNADAHKGYTVGQFRSSNLPYTIPPYQKGDTVTCAT